MSYNHTGAIGFAYWEENWPVSDVPDLLPAFSTGSSLTQNWLNIRDPMLSVLDFMRCGNIFFPIPMVPVPIPSEWHVNLSDSPIPT